MLETFFSDRKSEEEYFFLISRKLKGFIRDKYIKLDVSKEPYRHHQENTTT